MDDNKLPPPTQSSQRGKVKLSEIRQRTDSEDNPGTHGIEKSAHEEILIQTLQRLKDHVTSVSQARVNSPGADLVFSSSVENDMKQIWKATKYTPDEKQRRHIAEIICSSDFLGLCDQLWILCHWKSMWLFDMENYSVFKVLKQCLYAMWNISDISPDFCQSLCDSGFVNTFQLTLANHFKSERPFLNNDRVVSYAKCLLGILHNVVRQREDSHSILRQNLKLFMLFSLSDHLMVKTKAIMILSYIVKETETSMITSNQETITFMTLLLRNALESPYHFSTKYGISVSEVLSGLNNLAANDSNKTRIVDSGILPLYVSLLQPDCTDNEQLLAAKGLWLISFCKARKEEFLKSGCVEALKRLEKCDIEALCHAARGALWEIQNTVVIGQDLIEPVPVENFASPMNVPHVMISYQWDSKPIMLKVKDKLKDAGYKVWMDVEQMSGSTLEAMALAVEGAAVVIVAMSQKYKDSPSCRTEAEYTYKLRKVVLPLQVEPSYTPDGWLGMLVGTRLYISIYHMDQVEALLPKILSELGNRGKLVSPDNRVSVQRTTQQTEQQIQKSHLQEVGAILNNSRQSVDWRKWSEVQVADWLSKSGINRLSVFPEMDGSLLAELHRMYDRAPEVFFNMLKSELKLLLKERLQLSRALSSLP